MAGMEGMSRHARHERNGSRYGHGEPGETATHRVSGRQWSRKDRWSRSVRTVGIITYDETKITQVYSKIEGWIDKLYVNYTGKLVEKGQPLFTIYSPDLLATQQEYLLAIKAKERLSASSIPEVRSGAAVASRSQ